MRILGVIVVLCMVTALGCVGSPSQAGEESKQRDPFAELAARQADYAEQRLAPVEPPKLTRKLLPLAAQVAGVVFQPAEKIATAEQLRAELQRQRELHQPYLQNLAPPLEKTRIRAPLTSFDWRLETEADRHDFAGVLEGRGAWQRVKIPHYGGPMGRAVAYYRTEFELTAEMLAEGAAFVRFQGADYKAHVFLNGTYLGSHEGIFAPFEFDFTGHARLGKNVLVVKLVNDFIMLGNDPRTGFIHNPTVAREFRELQGDKLYAAVGPGWDEPEVGWHACPPGMGIYQDVAIEARRPMHIHDVFVRPLPEESRAEAWIEVFSCGSLPQPIVLQLSLFGQNFSATEFRDHAFAPEEVHIAGLKRAEKRPELKVQQGMHYFKLPVRIPKPRLWEPATPWLYQLQVKLRDAKGRLLDAAQRQFGMRSFRMDVVGEPKGRMFLNGRGIKLRGANTMGALQRCVMGHDWPQLIDDILLAKITHLNYMRLTQMPVQSEIYDYCDRLGLMLQSDLPLFGVLRRGQFCEALRQVEEMEHLVRPHPSNIMVTYINEPFATDPQRVLSRSEMRPGFFQAADIVVRLANPDRVIKAVDGDYQPPGPGLPDNHCYCGWYNGHGLDLGLLHKGYWQRVKPGWVYGCGEFGAEGLDPVPLMRQSYPKHWLPQTAEEERVWTPHKIPGAQTGERHQLWFETPHTLADWVGRSQAHQAWATRLMTEAFRRDRRMHSFAIHLFIDAFPDSWMKAILDCQRNPKPAWFAYREALTPLAVNLRSDRHGFFAGQPIELEAWVCNDRPDAPAGAKLHYQLELNGKVLQAGAAAARVSALDAIYQGTVRFQAPPVAERSVAVARLGLLDAGGKVLHDVAVEIDIFPPPAKRDLRRVYVLGHPHGKAAQLAAELGAVAVAAGPIGPEDTVLIDDAKEVGRRKPELAAAVRQGARAVLVDLPAGSYSIAATALEVQAATPSVHFVSRDTGHPFVDGFRPNDFRFWYDAQADCPAPLMATIFHAAGWKSILHSGGDLVAAEKPEGQGAWYVCQLKLVGRTGGNPVAAIFARRLLGEKGATP